MIASRQRLSALLTPVVERGGCDLEDVTVSPAGRRRMVRVTVDRDGGVSLDDVADVSRLLSEALDDIDAREPHLLGGAYVLEVSSPGIDRPLTTPRHWRRAIGRLVVATLSDGTTVSGRVVDADDTLVGVDVEAGGTRRLPYEQVARGVIQVEFNRPGSDPAQDDADGDDVW